MAYELVDAVLDANEWLKEAEENIKDVHKHVNRAEISDAFGSSNTGVHFNIETFEGKKMCIRLSANGLKVVGSSFDKSDLENDSDEFYETIHALLDKTSPMYRESFTAELQKKLVDVLASASEGGVQKET